MAASAPSTRCGRSAIPSRRRNTCPQLASGQRLSAFALTEPNAGSDLTALRTTAVRDGDDYVINGEKLFITNVMCGRTIGLVCLLDKKPAVFIVDLPDQESEHFRLKPYGLYALRYASNQGFVFKDFRVPAANLLKPVKGDGLTIAYHGLNLGRVALCANAAGTMRLMLANMLPWAKYRKTYGQADRDPRAGRAPLGRMAGLIVACDALVEWCSRPDRQGLSQRDGMRHRQDLRQRIAEGSRDRAVDEDPRRSLVPARPYLRRQRARVPRPLHLRRRRRNARHGVLQVAGEASRHAITSSRSARLCTPPASRSRTWPTRPMPGRSRVRCCRTASGTWARRSAARAGRHCRRCPRRLRKHAEFAAQWLGRSRMEVSGTMSRHQLGLADRQCRMSELSQRSSGRDHDPLHALCTPRAARKRRFAWRPTCVCQDLTRKLTREPASDRYFRTVTKLGQAIANGEFKSIAGLPEARDHDAVQAATRTPAEKRLSSYDRRIQRPTVRDSGPWVFYGSRRAHT